MVPGRREHILGFDRMHGIEIADLADRLLETWPAASGDRDGLAQARIHVEALDRSVTNMTRIVLELQAELVRMDAVAAEAG